MRKEGNLESDTRLIKVSERQNKQIRINNLRRFTRLKVRHISAHQKGLLSAG